MKIVFFSFKFYTEPLDPFASPRPHITFIAYTIHIVLFESYSTIF